jgi:SAM-dependent methyltransferase
MTAGTRAESAPAQRTDPAAPEDSRRSIDLRYLARPALTTRPHYFPFVRDAARDRLGALAAPRVCELGCANGAFAAYLLEIFPELDYTGVDVLPELVACARTEVPGGAFAVGDVAIPESLPRGPFDAVFMLTIHSLFDEPASWVRSIRALLAPSGTAYVFGLFNPEPVDVRVRLRDRGAGTEWLPGWNQLSEHTVAEALDSCRLAHRFIRYRPVHERAPDPVDPLRSYTVPDPEGGLVYLNGGQFLHRFALLEVTRP